MVINESGVVVSDAVEQLVPLVLEKFGPLITIFKAVGVVFLAYVIYIIVRSIMKWKDSRRIKRIEQKVDLIVSKLGLSLDKKVKEKKKKKKDRK